MEKNGLDKIKAKIKNKARVFWKPFAFFFLLGALLANWHSVSKIDWGKALLVSNYRYVFAKIGITGQDRGEYNFLNYNNFIEVPKLNLKSPISFAGAINEKGYQEALKNGVLFYPASALPGEVGQTVILGHSAPALWPDIDYDNIFNDLDKLIAGNEIWLKFGKSRYKYIVKKLMVLESGQEISNTEQKQSSLILITCLVSEGRQKRLVVEAVLN